MKELNKAVAEFAKEIKDCQLKLANLAFEKPQGKLKDVHLARKIRKQIARALTKIHNLSYTHE